MNKFKKNKKYSNAYRKKKVIEILPQGIIFKGKAKDFSIKKLIKKH